MLRITKKLVNVDSIVNTAGERHMADYIYDYLATHPYFIKNGSQLVREQTINDDKERYNVLAYVRGTGRESQRTVVLMGHLDTVGVDDFTQQRELAFSPDEWMSYLQTEKIPAQAERHLKSGDWLFGRGVLDMKSGLASHIYLLTYYATHPELLNGNLVFIAECDEEDSSHGILSALKTLKKWKKNHHFDYVAAINGDFVAPAYEGDDHRYVYKGTVGKLLPSFFIVSEETHVGSPFDGLDPNFIAAELTRQINYNPDLSDTALGEATLPPVSLKQTDLKPSYTVQTALSAYVYYNFFVHSWSPQEVLELLKNQATFAFENALTAFRERYQRYCEKVNQAYRPIPWQPRVLTYQEMDHLLIETHGKVYEQHMRGFKDKLLEDETLDIRMFTARVVEEAWKFMTDKSPTIIVFYSSLYSPYIALTGKTDDKRNLLQALEDAIDTIQPVYQYPIVAKNFFPHISDMSFVAMSHHMDEIDAALTNTPSYREKFHVDYEDVNDLNIPVINIGPYGMDGHKKLERMEMTFSLEIVPNLTNHVIQNVLNDGDE